MWAFLKQRWQDVLAVMILALTAYLYLYAPDKVDTLDFPAPPLAQLSLIDGTRLPETDLQGRVLLVNFWATWCGFCKQELPSLDAMQKELGPRGLTVLALSMDDNAPIVTRFLQEHPYAFRVGMATRPVARAFGGASALPTTYIVDRKGTVRHKIEGWVRQGVLEQLVDRYL